MKEQDTHFFMMAVHTELRSKRHVFSLLTQDGPQKAWAALAYFGSALHKQNLVLHLAALHKCYIITFTLNISSSSHRANLLLLPQHYLQPLLYELKQSSSQMIPDECLSLLHTWWLEQGLVPTYSIYRRLKWLAATENLKHASSRMVAPLHFLSCPRITHCQRIFAATSGSRMSNKPK